MGLLGDGPAPLAGCPGCRAPLIATFLYPGKEFICLECGRTVTFMGPIALEHTPENDARMAALQAEWDAHAGDLIIRRAWNRDCEQCKPMREENYHHLHATEEEIAADKAAREWIASRRQGVPR